MHACICMLLIIKSDFCQKVTIHKDQKFPFISNLKKSVCVPKRDVLELATLRYEYIQTVNCRPNATQQSRNKHKVPFLSSCAWHPISFLSHRMIEIRWIYMTSFFLAITFLALQCTVIGLNMTQVAPALFQTQFFGSSIKVTKGVSHKNLKFIPLTIIYICCFF